MKSTKEIADMTGFSKMTVYRYIKANNISDTSQEGRTLLYDDTTVNLIVKGLLAKSDVSEDVTPDTSDSTDFKEEYIKKIEEINEFLQNEVDDKNKQIENLQTILNQQQQLLLYEQQKNTKLLEENIDSKKWWQWWK